MSRPGDATVLLEVVRMGGCPLLRPAGYRPLAPLLYSPQYCARAAVGLILLLRLTATLLLNMVDTRLTGTSWHIIAAILFCGLPYAYCASKGQRVRSSPDIPVTQFSCADRPPGYYADVETGCQVYHMCTEGGNQFSYKCPNTTLFQQRMLICAHWYQVNCSRSEQHYGNNLLIGQRDKPFVNDDSILTKDKQLKTLQNPEILQNLGQAGREGLARRGKAQATSENVQPNRVFQNNLKRDQGSSVGFAEKGANPSSTPFHTASRRNQEDLASLPLAGSVIPGGLKSVNFSPSKPQGSPFNPSFEPSVPFQQGSTSQIKFVSRAPFQNQQVTQGVSFISPSSSPNSVDNISAFTTTKSPFAFTTKTTTVNQNQFQPSGFTRQPSTNFLSESSTSKPGFEFIPPPGQKPSVDLAVASQENALGGRSTTSPEPESEIGGGLPEIETTIKAIIEVPKNGSLPEDKFNTFINRFDPFEKPPQPTTESEITTEQTDNEYNTFINRFVPDQTLFSSHTKLGQPIEEPVFINRFVLTPEEIKKEKDRVQVDKLHNLLPPDDQVTVNFPNFDLIPPLDDSVDSESNKIELHLQDPRRTLFIPSGEDSSFSKADAAPILVSIPLHSQDRSPQMWFRTEDSTDPCARCHPSFLVNKDTCMPCVIIR